MIYSGIEDMDIKSGGREMATVVYSNEEDCAKENEFTIKIFDSLSS